MSTLNRQFAAWLLTAGWILAAGVAGAAPADQVTVTERSIVLPTYEMGPPDPCPIFVQHRSYQGAEAPVYPYPMWDAVTDVRTDRTYRVICLENRYVEICVLPEIGGRVLSARDKTSGYDFLYRQHVIKPALIGMVGAWISGGIEWNIPHHHRASTFMPVASSVSRNADGSATVRVGEMELRHRMRWIVELTLRPDSSCVEQTVRLVNRTPEAQSFLFFANIAVPATPDYQVIFPPDTHWVTNHGKREFARWPVSESIYNGIDFRPGVDVSWWKNHPSSISMFAWGSQMDFLAGYDHRRRAGVVHVADHHISPGKKFFTWGAGDVGRMWDRMLTDRDGPYIELMAGAYSDNQPDYSWVQPYQTKTAQAFWYPVAEVGGVKNANRHAAVNLDVTPANTARIGVAVTSEHLALTVTLAGAGGVLFEKETAAGPGRPFLAECPVPSGAGRLTLRARSGQAEIISYTMVDGVAGPEPEVVRPPARPEAIQNLEELYYAGLRLEQLHSAVLDPEDYYREALRRDPGHAKANVALGIRALRGGDYAGAETLLRNALVRTAPAYLRPRDGEASYYLGLAQRAQHKDESARDNFAQAAWVAGWESPANLQLAELICARGDYAGAIEYLDRALAANAANLKALTLKAAVLRKLHRPVKAHEPLDRAVALDALDPWPAWERAFSKGEALPLHTDEPQDQLEVANDYAEAAMWEDAAAVLAASTGRAASHPLVQYFLAYCLEQAGHAGEAEKHYVRAAQLPPDYVFPFRRETESVLLRALARNPADHCAAYYLGNLLFLQGRADEAIARWEDSRRLNPAYAMVHRNLAVAYARQAGRLAEAITSLEAAMRLDPQEPRFGIELDQLQEAAGVPVEKRLARLESIQSIVVKRDDTLSREIALLVAAGRYERALELMQGRQFHVWEGAGRTAVHFSFVEAHLELGHRHRAAGRLNEALAEYQMALEYPVNLGTGRPVRGERLSETHYFCGLAQEALGDGAAARRSFEAAVATAPATLLSPQRPAATEAPEASYYAARSMQKCGRAADAARIAQGLIAAGNAQLQEHVSVDFFAAFGSAETKSGRAAQAHYMIGLGHLASNQPSRAREAFGRALQLNDRHRGAAQQLARAEAPGKSDATPDTP